MHERIFIGDVQGCLAELEALLDALAYDPARHELWFAGDLVNRGPASAATLRRAIELDAGSVLGNHDLHLLAAAQGVRRARKTDTFGDVLAAPDRDALLAWLQARPLVVEWDDLVLVHAGLHPGWTDLRAVAAPLEARIAKGELPLDDPDLQFLTRVRHCTARGERPKNDIDPGPGYAPWDEHYRGERTVVCGHWSQRGVVCRDRLRSLDGGCVWGGELAAWLADRDRTVRVPARRAYQKPG